MESENLVIIDLGNGLLPVRQQAIAWTKDDLLSIRRVGTHFSEIQIKIYSFSLKKTHLKMSFVEFQPILFRC